MNIHRRSNKILTSPCQESKVEDTAQPVILGANQMQIIPDPENRSITESCLVDVEEGIADGEIRKNHEVDLTLQGTLVLLRDSFMKFVRIREEGQGGVSVAGAGGEVPFGVRSCDTCCIR